MKLILYKKIIRHIKNTKEHYLKPLKISKTEYKELTIFYNEVVKKASQIINTLTRQELLTPPSSFILFTNYQEISSGDALGKVVTKNGNYYRIIKKEAENNFINLYKTGLLQYFGQIGAIPKIYPTEYRTNDSEIVIQVEKVEWIHSFKLTDYNHNKLILFTSILQKICRANNCYIDDPHSGNICMKSGGSFFYIDIGSFMYYDKQHINNKDLSLLFPCYRSLFSFFPNSILFQYNLGGLREGIEPKYKLNWMEYRAIYKKYYHYHKLHSSSIVNKAIKKIFLDYKCEPQDISLLLCNGEKDSFNFI